MYITLSKQNKKTLRKHPIMSYYQKSVDKFTSYVNKQMLIRSYMNILFKKCKKIVNWPTRQRHYPQNLTKPALHSLWNNPHSWRLNNRPNRLLSAESFTGWFGVRPTQNRGFFWWAFVWKIKSPYAFYRCVWEVCNFHSRNISFWFVEVVDAKLLWYICFTGTSWLSGWTL